MELKDHAAFFEWNIRAKFIEKYYNRKKKNKINQIYKSALIIFLFFFHLI